MYLQVVPWARCNRLIWLWGWSHRWAGKQARKGGCGPHINNSFRSPNTRQCGRRNPISIGKPTARRTLSLSVPPFLLHAVASWRTPPQPPQVGAVVSSSTHGHRAGGDAPMLPTKFSGNTQSRTRSDRQMPSPPLPTHGSRSSGGLLLKRLWVVGGAAPPSAASSSSAAARSRPAVGSSSSSLPRWRRGHNRRWAPPPIPFPGGVGFLPSLLLVYLNRHWALSPSPSFPLRGGGAGLLEDRRWCSLATPLSAAWSKQEAFRWCNLTAPPDGRRAWPRHFPAVVREVGDGAVARGERV
jgi:hypothetical protein